MESSEAGSMRAGWKTGAMDRSYEDIVYDVVDPVAMITQIGRASCRERVL